MFSAQAAANKKTGSKDSAAGAVTEDSVLKDIMAELKQEPVLIAKPPQRKNTSMSGFVSIGNSLAKTGRLFVN